MDAVMADSDAAEDNQLANTEAVKESQGSETVLVVAAVFIPVFIRFGVYIYSVPGIMPPGRNISIPID